MLHTHAISATPKHKRKLNSRVLHTSAALRMDMHAQNITEKREAKRKGTKEKQTQKIYSEEKRVQYQGDVKVWLRSSIIYICI